MRWWWKKFCILVIQVHLAHSSSVKRSETVEFGNMHHSRHMHTMTIKPMAAQLLGHCIKLLSHLLFVKLTYEHFYQ